MLPAPTPYNPNDGFWTARMTEMEVRSVFRTVLVTCVYSIFSVASVAIYVLAKYTEKLMTFFTVSTAET